MRETEAPPAVERKASRRARTDAQDVTRVCVSHRSRSGGEKGEEEGGGDLLDSADMTFLGASNPVGFRPPKR